MVQLITSTPSDTLGREFESRYLVIFPHKNKKQKTAQVENTKFDFTVDEGKDRLNPSREKN